MDKMILILDDEQECVLSLKKFLAHFLHEVVITLYPKDALELIQTYKPMLVLFDYKMPEMNGDQFLEKAKALSPKTRYVLMTAYRDDLTLERFKKIGVDEVMMKPLDLEKILALIEELNP